MGASKAAKNTAAKGANGVNRAKDALKGTSKVGIGGAALDLGLNAYLNMQNGDNFGTALVKAVPESIAWAVAPGLMTGIVLTQLAPAAVTGYMAADSHLRGKYNKNHKAGTMFSYQDSRAALTMRQAAVQAIQGSKMNARNALGGEASLMHRSWSDRM